MNEQYNLKYLHDSLEKTGKIEIWGDLGVVGTKNVKKLKLKQIPLKLCPFCGEKVVFEFTPSEDEVEIVHIGKPYKVWGMWFIGRSCKFKNWEVDSFKPSKLKKMAKFWNTRK